MPYQAIANVGTKAAGLGVSGAATAGISIAAFAAQQLIQHYLGMGRRTANSWVSGKDGQDAFQKNVLAPAAIIAQTDPAKAAELTAQGWKQYLNSASTFAAKGKNQAKVVQQNLTTPAFMQTVSTLLGNKNPLDTSYTQQTGIGGPGLGPNTNPAWGTILATAAAVAPSILKGLEQAPTSGSFPSNPATVPGNPGSVNVEPAAPGAPPRPSLISRLLPQLISGGTSLVTGVLGQRAATRAAETQAQSAEAAAAALTKANENTLAFNRDVLKQQQANAQPWLDAGTGALRKIGEINATPYKLPTEEEAMASPGIQFQLTQGQRALEAYQRKHGTLISGKAIKDINQFAQGVASTGYQNVVNRGLQERDANLNPLLSVAGLGQVSTAQQNSNLGSAANLNANVVGSGATNIADMNTSAAAARASGYVGGANAIGGAITNIGNNLLDTTSIQELLRRYAA